MIRRIRKILFVLDNIFCVQVEVHIDRKKITSRLEKYFISSVLKDEINMNVEFS